MFLLMFCAAIFSSTTAAVIESNPHLNRYHGLKAHKVEAMWDDADTICRSEGGYLASPISEDILKDIKHFLDASREDNTYYIGTRARQVPGQYVSIEGTALEDMPVFDMLERVNPDEGDCLTVDSRRISVVPCRTPLPFICQLNETEPNNTLLNNTEKHDCITEGYRYEASTNRCYKHYAEFQTWSEGEATCVADGGHLVVADDDNEWRIIRDIIVKKKRPVWAGFRDVGHGDWRSIEGIPMEQLYHVWSKGSTPAVDRYKCGFMRYDDGLLEEGVCRYTGYFICEKHPE